MVPNPPSVSEKQGDHGAPDIWPEMFIPIVQGDDGRDAYLPAGEVDRRPAPESAIFVPFPKDGVLYTEKGEVVLLLFIGANGRVDDVKVESANVSLPFQRSALEAFRSAKMIPGIKNGVSVSVKMRVVVEFEESSIN
ncbi:MAG: energy transducer TonB [Betaproteobacteria bacterium]